MYEEQSFPITKIPREGEEHMTLSMGQYIASKDFLAKEGNRCGIRKASVHDIT